MNTPFDSAILTGYLRSVLAGIVANVRATPLGGGRQGDKGYGYGKLLRFIDAVLESDVMRTQITPSAGYDEDERRIFYAALVHLG